MPFGFGSNGSKPLSVLKVAARQKKAREEAEKLLREAIKLEEAGYPSRAEKCFEQALYIEMTTE